MNLYQLRAGVRSLLRDATYPAEDVDAAINRVLRDINSLGRFRFHEATASIVLIAHQYAYPVPTGIIAEKALIFAPTTTRQFVIPKRSQIYVNNPIIPITEGDVPTEYGMFNNQFYLYPRPSVTMALDTMSVLYLLDIPALMSDTSVCALPERWSNVPIYGAVSQLAPVLLIESVGGKASIEVLYNRALNTMKMQELWRANDVPIMHPGIRFTGKMNTWGRVNA